MNMGLSIQMPVIPGSVLTGNRIIPLAGNAGGVGGSQFQPTGFIGSSIIQPRDPFFGGVAQQEQMMGLASIIAQTISMVMMNVMGMIGAGGQTGGNFFNGIPGGGGIPNIPQGGGFFPGGGIPNIGAPNIGFPNIGIPNTGFPVQGGGISGGPTVAPGAGVNTTRPQLSMDDLTDFVLAGSEGGTVQTQERIDSRFSRPGSRLSATGQDQFDGFVALAYSAQFKAAANGADLDVVFNPGDDVNTVAQNIFLSQNLQLNPEAQLLADVAATFRGTLDGKPNTYVNTQVPGLLDKWVQDGILDADAVATQLAENPGIGSQQDDVSSIGKGLVWAINQVDDKATRDTMLNDIFDFQNLTPNSPSGVIAAEDAQDYIRAIQVVQSGTLNALGNQFNTGVQTSRPEGTPMNLLANGVSTTGQVDPNSLYAQLKNDPEVAALNAQETQRLINEGKLDPNGDVEIDAFDRALLHRFGNALATGTDAIDAQGGVQEKSAMEELIIEKSREIERERNANGVETDRSFYEMYFTLHQKLTGSDLSSLLEQKQFGAVTQGDNPVIEGVAARQQAIANNGVSSDQLLWWAEWAHDVMDGEADMNAFVAGVMGPQLTGINDPSLSDFSLRMDMADNGLIDASFYNSSGVVDDFITGAILGTSATTGPTRASAQQRSVQAGLNNGLNMNQIMSNMSLNVTQGFRDLSMGIQSGASMMVRQIMDNPGAAIASVGGIAAATAVCPWLGGLGLAGTAAMAGQQLLQGNLQGNMQASVA
ncbi:MAG: hypothetical protein SFZ03_08590 [Candidatus Melainabacteria bacterium]|nr:hypothetical protein [Candidatus Melainabacteria bacterium]